MIRSVLALFSLCLLFSCTDNNAPVTKATGLPAERTMDSLSAQISEARRLQTEGKLPQALGLAETVLQRFPGQLDALGIKAEILKEQGKRAEALAVLEKAYRLQPRDKETAYNLAYEYADAKSPKTLPLTDTLLKYDKTETVARAWYIRALYFKNLGNGKEAMRYYDSSIAADYNFLDSYLEKGQLLFAQKKWDAALKTFALGQKLSPSAAEFYFWVAKTQEATGNRIDAKANYERAYALDKELTEAKAAAERL